LKEFIDGKEENIIKLNDELSKDFNVSKAKEYIDKIHVGVKHQQYGSQNSYKLLEELEKAYDIYNEVSTKPQDTNHFLEVLVPFHKDMIESYVKVLNIEKPSNQSN
jgi:hypothetical protein